MKEAISYEASLTIQRLQRENLDLKEENFHLREHSRRGFLKGYLIGSVIMLGLWTISEQASANTALPLEVTSCSDFRSLAYDVAQLRQQGIRHTLSYLSRDYMSHLHSAMLNSAFQWPRYLDPKTKVSAATRFADTWAEACDWNVFSHTVPNTPGPHRCIIPNGDCQVPTD